VTSCWELATALAAHNHPAVPPHTVVHTGHDIFQVSTMSVLVAGVFDGDTPYGEVMQHGDFGVGTFNALDGEMAAVDGRYLHLHSDGTVGDVDPAELTPFAAVTFFRADAEVDVDRPHSRAELEGLIDGTVPSRNLFYAVRVDGRFASVTTRTAARQRRPYPRLAATTATQTENVFTAVSGTLVGFRAPAYAQGMTVAGYHLHFVDETRTYGGHVLDFALESGTVLIDQDADLHVEMPTAAAFLGSDLEGQDSTTDAAALSAEIEQAENRPGGTGGGARG
jgi:acetolactate decarboxylase